VAIGAVPGRPVSLPVWGGDALVRAVKGISATDLGVGGAADELAQHGTRKASGCDVVWEVSGPCSPDNISFHHRTGGGIKHARYSWRLRAGCFGRTANGLEHKWVKWVWTSPSPLGLECLEYNVGRWGPRLEVPALTDV